jgi:ATP-dependent Lon protease
VCIMAKKRKQDIHPSTFMKIELEPLISSETNFTIFINEKIKRLHKIIQNIVLSTQKHKNIDIFSNSELNVCNNNLTELYNLIEELKSKCLSQIPIDNQPEILAELQQCFDKISTIMSSFGNINLEDILYVVFGKDYKIKLPITNQSEFSSKLELIKTHVSYIGYKMTPWKKGEPNKYLGLCNDKITDNTIIAEDYCTLECFEPITLHRSFYYSTQGIRIVIQNEKLQKTLILSGVVNGIEGEWLTTENYIKYRKSEILEYIDNHMDNIDKYISERLVSTFCLKDYLIYSANDVCKKYMTCMVDVEYVKTHDINAVIKRFLEMDIIHQRGFLMQLLIYDKEYNVHYIAYMLYDLLTGATSVSSNEKIDSDQQTLIYNSFPYLIKLYFKDAMKNTIQYSNESINKYDTSRVTIEQQVLLLKVSDIIKDKAITKLKEIKGKPDDQSGKAKQYLEGLLKIPFNCYKKEPILRKINIINDHFFNLISVIENYTEDNNNSDQLKIYKKSKYTVLEINRFTSQIIEKNSINVEKYIKETIGRATKSDLIHISNFIKTRMESKFSVKSTLTRAHIISLISDFIFSDKLQNNTILFDIAKIIDASNKISMSYELTQNITREIKEVRGLMTGINDVLDSSIYAHKKAKTQILKVISQWINGEQNGYCFGFEGSPGIGKTSLAKRGLATCLKDENGNARPFSFIALGGSCNGSTLEGHSYTYVNSTWGKIVDILMDSKCMNPIIYIDELDKVSKTEQGREIIGILTHLIDYSQNDEFQDKYFSGIPIDLSKVLFIFSYNDPELIDRILLDRIHRIKFENLSWEDKIVIANKFILPEINTKMGFCESVHITNDVLEYIIENFTLEPGIRKLKEILYDLYGEINIELLSECETDKSIEVPIIIKKEDLGKKYLKYYKKLVEKTVHLESKIGVINGLWASANGNGGIIPIECVYFPSSTFLDLRLTGMQGDVMKESMSVAKTLAWKLTPIETQQGLIKELDDTKNQGLHIHCPDGSVSKDGPSAGTAITCVIYSLLNNKKIKHNIAITGEITLQGNVTAIGGLDLKIIGGIRAGVKTFIYPMSNHREFEECELKYKKLFDKNGIKFIEVDKILDVFPHIFE